jgi:hypothetical protein
LKKINIFEKFTQKFEVQQKVQEKLELELELELNSNQPSVQVLLVTWNLTELKVESSSSSTCEIQVLPISDYQ